LNPDDLYKTAEKKLRKEVRGYEIAFGKEHSQTLEFQEGQTPLLWAAGNGYHNVVDLLLTRWCRSGIEG